MRRTRNLLIEQTTAACANKQPIFFRRVRIKTLAVRGVHGLGHPGHPDSGHSPASKRRAANPFPRIVKSDFRPASRAADGVSAVSRAWTPKETRWRFRKLHSRWVRFVVRHAACRTQMLSYEKSAVVRAVGKLQS